MANNFFKKVELMAIVSNDLVKKSDVVVCLQGDGYNRLGQTIKVYQDGLAKNILISGGLTGGSAISASKLAKRVPRTISKNRIIIEEISQNTYEQGMEVMKIVKARKWKKIILVASHFHQPRAYLTFLKAMKNLKLKIQIFNAPVRDLSWFDKTSLGLTRIELLQEEFKKIDKYIKKGHLVSMNDAVKYQIWKEKQK